jgi:hypothetical protein
LLVSGKFDNPITAGSTGSGVEPSAILLAREVSTDKPFNITAGG